MSSKKKAVSCSVPGSLADVCARSAVEVDLAHTSTRHTSTSCKGRVTLWTRVRVDINHSFGLCGGPRARGTYSATDIPHHMHRDTRASPPAPFDSTNSHSVRRHAPDLKSYATNATARPPVVSSGECEIGISSDRRSFDFQGQDCTYELYNKEQCCFGADANA